MNWINKKLLKRIFWYRAENKLLRSKLEDSERVRVFYKQKSDRLRREMYEVNKIQKRIHTSQKSSLEMLKGMRFGA